MKVFEKMTVDYVDPHRLKVFDYSRKLFPELKGEAYEFLKDDIKENGIRTPLEVTHDFLILCGHERHRVALELGLQQVPVIFYPNGEVTNQKIRCIKDNLARKAVDTRTKVKCYGELRQLYGFEHGGDRRSEDFKCLGGHLNHKEIGEEVGLPRQTFDRAIKIEESDLPEEIKDAAFKGKLGIEPTANLIKEPKTVQKQAVKQILEELKTDKEHVFVQNIVDQIKGEDCEPSEAVSKFFDNYKEALKQFPEEADSEKAKLDKAIQFFKQIIEQKHVVCPVCGEKKLQWRCGHDF